MADTGAPGFIPLASGSDQFSPPQAPLNALATALNTALSKTAFNQYPTKAALDLAPGTIVGQHATVNADTTTPANNRDYTWSGTAWVGIPTLDVRNTTSKSLTPAFRAGSTTGTTSAGGDLSVTFPSAFPNAIWAVVIIDTNTGSGIGPVIWKMESKSITGFTARAFNSGSGAAIPSFATSFDYIAIGQ